MTDQPEESKKRKPTGFAAMPEEKRREASAKGGRVAHAKGTAYEFTSETARAAGQKGGRTTSQIPGHMSAIGSEGGKNSHGGGARPGHPPTNTGKKK
jgi:uncharacterized protein